MGFFHTKAASQLIIDLLRKQLAQMMGSFLTVLSFVMFYSLSLYLQTPKVWHGEF